jgi:pSer/pThr/pTyr-binding forkhead associated (FHA) protein
MTDHSIPSTGNTVAIHLLDSAQGHPLQTWRFTDQDTITIGRNNDNDIAIADPHVSRAHVKLTRQDNVWMLLSTGRHGTLINDRVVAESPIKHQTIFRLGSMGPMLRMDTEMSSGHHSETVDNVLPEMFDMLEIDELRKQQEVEEIAGNSLFQDLQEQSRQLRAMKRDDSR